MRTDKRVSHLRSWSGPQGNTEGITKMRGRDGQHVYRLNALPTDPAADCRENLMAELAQQRASRLKP